MKEDENREITDKSSTRWKEDRDLEKVRKLLIEGIDVNEVDENGDTALIGATMNGHLEIASLLIDYGATINHQNQDGCTALLFAFSPYRSNFSIVSLLIEKGADVNIKSKFGVTPLNKASFRGYFSIVSLLLRNGADTSLLNKYGRTALDLARQQNKLDCVGILENYEHFHRYRKVWLSFSTSLSSYQDNQNQESKESQSQTHSPSLMRAMDSSDLVRYLTEFM